jgi:hypothetical protein
MSLASTALNIFSINEPRMDLNNNTRSYVVLKGGETVTTSPYVSNSVSSSNPSSLNFQVIPPGKKAILDRMVCIQVPLTLTFSGTNSDPTTNFLQKGCDALRAYPLSSITQTLSVQLNTQTIKIDLSECCHVLERFKRPIDDQKVFLSGCCNMADQYQDYRDGLIANNNPLADYGTSSPINPRGAFPMRIISNTNNSAVIEITVTEYLMLPPFLFNNKSEHAGLTHLDTCVFKFTLNGQSLAHLWSHNNYNNSGTCIINNFNANFSNSYLTNGPQILCTWITPKATQMISPIIVYPYFDVVQYRTGGSSISPAYSGIGAPIISRLQFNTLILNTIPWKIYIFAKQSISESLATINSQVTSTDTYFRIDNINVSWDNQNGLFSSAQAIDLWRMSVINGCNLSWPEWFGTTQSMSSTGPPLNVNAVGSIICIELGKDIALRIGQCPGQLCQINFSFFADVVNINPYLAMTPDLYAICVYDGTLTIGNNSALLEIGNITPSDVLNAPENPNITYNHVEKMFGGGDFFSTFKDIASGIGKNIVKYGPDILRGAVKLLPMIGLGEGEGGIRAGDDGGMLDGGRKHRRKRRSGSKSHHRRRGRGILGGEIDGGCDDCELGGGRRVSRSHMRKRLG